MFIFIGWHLGKAYGQVQGTQGKVTETHSVEEDPMEVGTVQVVDHEDGREGAGVTMIVTI